MQLIASYICRLDFCIHHCYVTLCYVTLCYVTLCYVTVLCNFVLSLCYVILCHGRHVVHVQVNV